MNTKNESLLTRRALRYRGIRVANTTLLRWEANARFPRRVRLGGASVAWLKSEVDAWIEARAAERAGWHYGDNN